MPLYSYRCTSCGAEQDLHRSVDDRAIPAPCTECDGTAEKILTVPSAVHGDIEFVTDNITGDNVRITSKKQLRNLCAEHGVTEKIGKGWY